MLRRGLGAAVGFSVLAFAGEPESPVVALQAWRNSTTIAIAGPDDGPATATLVNLNPSTNTWFVLELARPGGDGAAVAHLENPDPAGQQLLLEASFHSGVVIASGAERRRCELWGGSGSALYVARRSGRAYAPLCEGRLYLRNATPGRKTCTEWATDLLRDHVFRGESIVGVVRDAVYRDAHFATSDLRPGEGPPAPELAAPPAALLAKGANEWRLVPAGLGLSVDQDREGRLGAGRWYPVRGSPGVFLSVIRPDLVAPGVAISQRGLVDPLDLVESGALVYLLAFDLELFDLGYELGTDHPRVDWSPAVVEPARDAGAGPDGFSTLDPLVRTGALNPVHAGQVAAAFTAGFKRAHGAFRWGALARVNRGSHYGFVSNGVVLSTLQPGLATVVAWDDGRVSMGTWTERDAADLRRVRHARQNGVAIIDRDEGTGAPRVGALVRRWGAGNWSGSADAKLRTLRAGLCLQETAERRFLSYGYFTSASPSAMARVFQAYGCRYAMLLDMNALEHTYLALYQVREGQLRAQHLIDGMSVLDMANGAGYLPRFVGFADNRDFFYLLRRKR